MGNNIYMQGLKRLYLWLAIGFVIYIAWNNSSELTTTLKSVQSLSIELMGLCLSLSGLSYLCRSLRWLGYIRLIEREASITRHIIIYLSGFAFTASPGKAGELMRGTYLDDLGVPFRYTFVSFISERLLDVMVVSLLGTYFLIGYFNRTLSLASLATFFLPFIIVPALNVLLTLLSTNRSFESVAMFIELWRMPIVFKSQFFTLLAWTAQGAILYLLLTKLGIKISIAMAVSIYCLSLLIGAASLIPGGIGATEVGMIWLLTQIGVSGEIAITCSLITRMLTLWPAMFTGLVCAYTLKSKSSSL
ncbi:flippase-like domain-containing protein [Vibrio kanaloae]|nr:flippase-like domain-containing protein [Vibrio kanaloae]